MSRQAHITFLAWLNVIVHAVALGMAAVGMRPGTPLVPLSERLEYLARAPLGWTLGWATWMICAIALIVFLAAVAEQLGDRAALARYGVVVAMVGAAFDLFCDSLYIVLFPMLAARPVSEELFLTVERGTGIASLVIANGAYSVSTLLFTLTMHRQGGVGQSTLVVGYAVAGFGLLLAGAGFTGVPWHAEWATGPTIGLFCVWVLLVARGLPAGGERP